MSGADTHNPQRPIVDHFSKEQHSNRFYDDQAGLYAKRTLSAPIPPLLNAFIQSLRPGSRLLDLGCGAGRDLLTLCRSGFDCLGVDLSANLVEIARAHTGAIVMAADMRTLDLGNSLFDGVVAIASLLHLSRVEQRRQLAKIIKWLRVDGYFLVTMKVGIGSEITGDDRRFTYIEPQEWLELMKDSGFEIVKTELTHGSNAVSTSDHDWLAVLAKKAHQAL